MTFFSPYFRFDAETFPSYWELIRSISLLVIKEDFLFYCSHRFFHHRLVYPYVHKKHHEVIYPVSISSDYCHWIEFLSANLMPMVLFPKLSFYLFGTNMHIFSIYLFFVIRITETVETHSGYDFPFSPFKLIPYGLSPDYHDYHHTNNIGNYGSFTTIWDTLFRTNLFYYKFLIRRQQKKIKSASSQRIIDKDTPDPLKLD